MKPQEVKLQVKVETDPIGIMKDVSCDYWNSLLSSADKYLSAVENDVSNFCNNTELTEYKKTAEQIEKNIVEIRENLFRIQATIAELYMERSNENG